MSVGGTILEIKPYVLTDPDNEAYKESVIRIWVIDPKHHDETIVYAEPQKVLPKMGDSVWWQGGKIFFDNDKQQLKKVGYSHPADGD